MIRIELYETARQLAGTDAVEIDASTLGEALVSLGRRCPPLEGVVVEAGRPTRHWRVSLNGRAFVDDPATILTAGDVVLVLSAMAGG